MDSNQAKKLTPDEFTTLAATAARTLVGYVAGSSVPFPSPPPANAPYILFGSSANQCPSIPIPHALIESIALGDQHSCPGSPGVMWSAELVLKDPASDEQRTLLRLALSFAAQLKPVPCAACQQTGAASASARAPLTIKWAFVVISPDGNRFSVTGYPSYPACMAGRSQWERANPNDICQACFSYNG